MNTLTGSLAARFRALYPELQNNRRLRWMVAAAALVFLLYLVLLAGDFRAAQQSDYKPLHRQLVRLEAMQAGSEEVDWGARLAAEQAVSAQLETRLWQASTAGLAAADFQAWLRGLAKLHEFENIRMEFSEIQALEEMQEPLWKLEAELKANARPASVVKFLAALAGNERMVILERVRYLPGRGHHFNALIVGYFRLGAGQEEPS